MAIGDDFEKLLPSAQEGDDVALEVIYRDLAPLVLGYLRGRGASDPEDLVSETFVAVVRNIGRFKGSETQFRSWVLTIAHRRLIDERRRRQRRYEDASEPTELEAVAEEAVAGDAADAALARLATGDVRRLLDELTEDQRSVILLRVVGELPVKEAARVLGKRPGAVKTLQRRALARLQRILDESHQTDNSGASRARQGGEAVS